MPYRAHCTTTLKCGEMNVFPASLPPPMYRHLLIQFTYCGNVHVNSLGHVLQNVK